MALDINKLKAELRKIMDPSDPGFVGWPANAAEAATNWANAYDTYALDAEDVSGDGILVVNKALFESTLASQLASSTTATTGAAAFAAAFSAYWTGATFNILSLITDPAPPCPNVGGNGVFAAEVTSVVAAVNPANITNNLKTEFENLSTSASDKVDAIAEIFDNATAGDVTVLISGTDSASAPITNTCTLF